jgi:hypothetical protein
MSDQRDDDAQDRSAFAGDTPPHVDPDDPRPELDDEALDTEALGEGGPAGA